MNFALLPNTVRELATLIGLSPTLALIKRYGGQSLTIPKGGRESAGQKKIAEILGDEATEILMRQYGGTVLSIPRCVKVLRSARDAEIINDYNNKMPVNSIAQKYELTVRHIWTILGRPPERDGADIVIQRSPL